MLLSSDTRLRAYQVGLSVRARELTQLPCYLRDQHAEEWE